MKRRVQDIEYEIVRGERKTADIVVERNGAVIVRAPLAVDDETVEHAVESRARWVHRTLAEWKDLNASRSIRPFVQGSGFPYLGRNYRLRIVSDSKAGLALRNGWWELSDALLAAEGEAGARKAFRDYYAERGAQIIPDRVEACAAKVGVDASIVTVRELGYHWASCGKNGALNFHWKLMMAPATVIEYVVVHELCHLRYRDHSEAFWNEVDKVLPRYLDRKEWLKRNGASLDI